MSRAFAPMILRDEGCAASFTIAWVSSLAFPGVTFTPKPSASTFAQNSGLSPVLIMGMPAAR